MKTVPYTLQEGVPQGLLGQTINIRQADTREEAEAQCSAPSQVVGLFNQSFRTRQQGIAKAAASSKATQALLAAGNVTGAAAAVQKAVDDYRVGVLRAAVSTARMVKGARERLAALTPQEAAKARRALEALGLVL